MALARPVLSVLGVSKENRENHMTPEEVEKLRPHDCLSGISPYDPILVNLGYHYKGEVVRRTEHGVIIRSDDPEDPRQGDLYSFSDRRLATASYYGSREFGEPPWLEKDRKHL